MCPRRDRRTTVTSCPADARAASGAASSCGHAVLEQHDRTDRDRGARSSSNATPARPAAAMSRPQFGSPPWMAVLTSGELAIVFAACRASAVEAAPVTVTVTSLVAPSPPRTISSARSQADRAQRIGERGRSRFVDRGARCAVGEQQHAVVGRAFAVDGDGVEGVVSRPPAARGRAAAVAPRRPSSGTRASSPCSARSCPSLSPCRRSRPRGCRA